MQKKQVPGGVAYNGVLYMGGLCALGKDVEEEIRRCFEMAEGFLKENGVGFENVLRGTVYLRDLNDRERVLNDIWKEYFPENGPARTCIEVGIANCRFEVDFVVALPE